MNALAEKKVRFVYKHLETDTEFAERIRKTHPWYRGDSYHKGVDLDDEVDASFGMQRKIVEVCE